MTDPSVNSAVAELLAEQVEEQRKSDEAGRLQLDSARALASQAREELINAAVARLPRRGQVQWPEKVTAIAQVLTQQPRLIEPVDQFLQALVKQINASIDKAIAEALAATSPAASGSTQPK